MDHKRGLERNVRLYPWFAAAMHTFFWLPIFFLFFSEHLTLPQILVLEAIYYAAVVVFEVPSGYFSDIVGRRPTLVISAAATAGSGVLFAVSSDFLPFALAQICFAIGISFYSGTDSSFHYDSLFELDRADEFGDREAVVARNNFYANALGAVVGGAIGIASLRARYLVSAAAATVALVFAILFVEPVHKRETSPGPQFLSQVADCVRYLKHPTLAWLFVFGMVMIVLNHVPYEFYQPYIRLSLGDLTSGHAPAVSGLHTALVLAIAGFVAHRSMRIRNAIGLARALLLAAVIQTVIIACMGLLLHPLVLLLVLARSTPRALMTAPISATVLPMLRQNTRATYQSMQSLAGRLSWSLVLLGLAGMGLDAQTTDFATLSRLMLACAGFGVVATLALALGSHRCITLPQLRAAAASKPEDQG